MLADNSSFEKIVAGQKNYFKSGVTLPYQFRHRQLQKLLQIITANEYAILEALRADLHKSEFEAWATEIGVLEQELKMALNKLRKWMRPKKLATPLLHAIGRSWIYPEPYGNTLVIAPWNYPFMLALRPAIGAIAAGNTCIIKPSEMATHTSALLEQLINTQFEKEYLHVITADATGSAALLENTFDYIFFTGSPRVGKIVYQHAAAKLTPVTLELGGKNPCLVDNEINLHVAASRIAWGKFSNAGQTCVAPDYALVNYAIKQQLLDQIIQNIISFYGDDPQNSKDFGRIINVAQFDRLQKIINNSKVIYGGVTNRDTLYISPTIVEVDDTHAAAMQEEIFGPILPVITYTDINDAIGICNQNADPLVCYLFTKNKSLMQKIQEQIPAGDMCINDVVIHFGHSNLPIGGRGKSGIGKYQGPFNFENFTHYKSVLHKTFIPDLSIRYPPFSELKRSRLKKLFSMFFN